MSLNPLNELKRRLEDNEIPLPKRLCLAKNVIKSHHFPSAPKERIVADWLQLLMNKNKLTCEDIRNIMAWLNVFDDVSSELKSNLIQIVAENLNKNPIEKEDVNCLLSFLENSKLTSQFVFHIKECLTIAIKLLQYLKAEICETNLRLSQRVFNNIIMLYKASKKKLEFYAVLLEGENLETVFSYLEKDRSTVVAVCGNILFPLSKKSFFGIYLQTLIRKDSINELLAEKGDNIESVLKIMNVLFTFPKGRTVKDHKFLSDFIDIFISCYYSESQLIFAFCAIVASSLRMEQNYLIPATTMEPIMFDENDDKIKRSIFLSMLQTVLKNEVDINVRLTDTLGVKITKFETKKTFMSFLENLMLSQLKLDMKSDKTSYMIVKTAMKLDPALVEHQMDKILPVLMAANKTSSSTLESYTGMLNCLLEILFKLSRGTIFLNQILPSLKNNLEAGNTEQLSLQEKLKKAMDNDEDCDKIYSKIINGKSVFPNESIELFGKLTSELMFRQNKDLLQSLQKNFEEHCLENMLQAEEISPSTITLTEVMTAILSSFLRHNKMADHTVSLQIANDFWTAFSTFETTCLKTFGKCARKFVNEPRILLAFLNLCLSCLQLKIVNLKYSNTKLGMSLDDATSDVFDLSFLLPCLSKKQWNEFGSSIQDEDALMLLDQILLLKTLAIQLLQVSNTEINKDMILATKSHLIKRLTKHSQLVKGEEFYTNVLFANLERDELKLVGKIIVKHILNTSDKEILNSVRNSAPLSNALVMETVKHICKCFNNSELLAKSINKPDFSLGSFSKEELKNFFLQLTIKDEPNIDTTLNNCIDILKQLKIYYLKEPYQLVAIIMLLATKRSCQKKIRKNVDNILLSIFELSTHPPDLYKIFPVEFIFSFEDQLMIELFTLKIKSSNNMSLIKCLVESAVKRVRSDSEIVKKIVDLLIKKQSACNSTSIEFFSEPAFQISCAILPCIIKQKKAITTSAYRSILADLQEKLHNSLLQCFKHIDFSKNSIFIEEGSGNTDESMVVSKSNMASLNSISAYSLTLSKYCETTDVEETKNLDHLWNGLEYFVNTAIQSIEDKQSKHQHVESSIRLLNSVLRYIKKLETHEIFQAKDKIFLRIWKCVKDRLSIVLSGDLAKYANGCLFEDIAVTLKFISELVSVEGFVTSFVGDLNNLMVFENPSKLLKNKKNIESISLKVCKYLLAQILKANIVGPKCVALSKTIYQSSRNLKSYIQQHFEADNGVVLKSKKKKLMVEFQDGDDNNEIKFVKVEDPVCEMIKIYLETLSEAVLSAKKINLDYKALDSIFEAEQSVHYIMGRNTLKSKCEVSWQAFYGLFEGSVAVLNSLVMSREELLEDRWPCFMQCYRDLVWLLCDRSGSDQLERSAEERLGQLGHSIEKLTQTICKRKTQVSNIATYAVGDISTMVSSRPQSACTESVSRCSRVWGSRVGRPGLLGRALAAGPSRLARAANAARYTGHA